MLIINKIINNRGDSLIEFKCMKSKYPACRHDFPCNELGNRYGIRSGKKY